MKIKEITHESGNDFTALLECEHCGQERNLMSGYHDSYYHTKVMPAKICNGCGKKRDGTKEEAQDDK